MLSAIFHSEKTNYTCPQRHVEVCGSKFLFVHSIKPTWTQQNNRYSIKRLCFGLTRTNAKSTKLKALDLTYILQHQVMATYGKFFAIVS